MSRKPCISGSLSLDTWTISAYFISICVDAKSPPLCLTLCNPKDCSPPGSSVYGILQGRILENVAISSFRGSSQGSNLSLLCLLSLQVFSSPQSHQGTPVYTLCLLENSEGLSPVAKPEFGLYKIPQKWITGACTYICCIEVFFSVQLQVDYN